MRFNVMVEQDNVEIPDISTILEEDIDNDDCDCVRESHFYSFEKKSCSWSNLTFFFNNHRKHD